MIKKTVSCFLLLLPNIIWANINATIDSTPDGIAQIVFESRLDSPKAFYGSVPLYVQKLKNGKYKALIGLPLMTKPGVKIITLQDANKAQYLINIFDKVYPDEHFKTAIKPNNVYIDDKRIKTERILFTKIRKTFSDKLLSEGYFVSPTTGRITSTFGSNRYYNGAKGLPHIGLDIANIIGTPVTASAAGRVILVHDFYYLGKTVIVDHGQGLITSYSHLDEALVIKGQLLRKSHKLGKIGISGRSNGPHLHWGVFLNQVAINPELLLKNPF